MNSTWAVVSFSFLWVFLSAVSSVDSVSNSSAAEEWLSKNKDAFVQKLVELLAIPSVSTHPDKRDEVKRAGQWVSDELKRIGMENVQFLEQGAKQNCKLDRRYAYM